MNATTQTKLEETMLAALKAAQIAVEQLCAPSHPAQSIRR